MPAALDDTIDDTVDAVLTDAEQAYAQRRMREVGYGSQKALGEATGMSQPFVSRVLHGKVKVSQVYRIALRRALGPDTPLDGTSGPLDNGTPQVSPGGRAAVSSGPGNSRAPEDKLNGHAFRVYLWGMQVDVGRPDDAPPDSYYQNPLATEESLRVGENGFGLKVEDDSLTLWECAENEPVRHGSVVWCNPDHIDGIQDGDLIVVRDPGQGLRAGVYRRDAAQEDGPLFLETADATAAVQQRRHIERSWIVGPVVYCTRGGIPRLVERQGRGDSGSPEPTGPAFVGTRSAQG